MTEGGARLPERRFELDHSAERAVSYLRLGAGAATGTGAIWLAIVGPGGTFGWLVTIAGGLAALGFFFAHRRGLRRAAGADRHFLLLTNERLTLADGKNEHQIDWRDVTNVEVDEERLVVVLTRGSRDPLAIEPRFEGVSVYELAQAIRAHWIDASADEMIK